MFVLSGCGYCISHVHNSLRSWLHHSNTHISHLLKDFQAKQRLLTAVYSKLRILHYYVPKSKRKENNNMKILLATGQL